MNSMTGFGRGEAKNGTVTVVVEMKSVNNRFRDVQLRLPREYNVLEPRVLSALRDRVQRGRLEVGVRRSSAEGATTLSVDLGVVDQLRAAARRVAQRIGVPPTELPVSDILRTPGVLIPVESEPDVLAEWSLLEAALESAVGELLAMRAEEGRALAADLRRNLDELGALRGAVASMADGVAERLRQRFTERMARLVGERVDPVRLAQEAALMADKADVSEELVRLQSHEEQFAAALDADEAVGRRLDFLLQEMNREINTLGSKSAEHPISARVVELKTVLERLREQAANVE